MSLLRASRKASRTAVPFLVRSFHASTASQYKVAVIGAAGGIGQPLSLLLKLHPKVTKLSLYDLAKVTPGVGVDLSHINTHAKVEAYTGDDMAKAVKDADIVVVPAGVPRKPGMSRDDLFNTNAGIVANIAKTCALNCPNANLLIISNPVNSTVPIVAEVLKRYGVYNKNKLFGVTTLDVCRANTFVAENQKLDVLKTSVPVVGGHAGITILPLLSQVPGTNFTTEEKAALTHRIMFGGDEVVKAKDGGGSATLSMAYAGSLFTDRVLRAMSGDSPHDIIECAYVESTLVPGVPFFASQVKLGRNGIEQIYPLPRLDAFETEKLEKALPELKDSIQKGVEFVSKLPK